MARPEKPVVGRKRGQADLFLFDPESGHRGPVELKRRHKDNGMDILRKEQIENAAAYEKVFGMLCVAKTGFDANLIELSRL